MNENDYTKAPWRFNNIWTDEELKKFDPDDELDRSIKERILKERAEGVFNDITGPEGESVIEYAGCGSHQMKIKKPGDRFLIQNAAVMFDIIMIVHKRIDLGDCMTIKEMDNLYNFIESAGNVGGGKLEFKTLEQEGNHGKN